MKYLIKTSLALLILITLNFSVVIASVCVSNDPHACQIKTKSFDVFSILNHPDKLAIAIGSILVSLVALYWVHSILKKVAASKATRFMSYVLITVAVCAFLYFIYQQIEPAFIEVTYTDIP
jgi:hypothetical protein